MASLVFGALMLCGFGAALAVWSLAKIFAGYVADAVLDARWRS